MFVDTVQNYFLILTTAHHLSYFYYRASTFDGNQTPNNYAITMMKISLAKQNSGFTIVELMLAVAIAAILIAVAAPSFRSTIENNGVLAISDDLITSLRYAREEALRQGLPISMCASSDQNTCTGTWSQGWIVFIDEDTNGTLNGADTIISAKQEVPGNYVLTLTGESTAYFRFDDQGFAPEKGSFQICPPSNINTRARGVVIHSAGGARYATDNDSDNIRENHEGVNFSC